MTQTDTSSPAANPRRPFWRWLVQYRLRTLLVVTTAVALILGWLAFKAERQRRAVSALRKSSARVHYRGALSAPEPWLAHWRYRVDSVSLTQVPTDNDVAALQALDGLVNVGMSDVAAMDVTDAGIARLKKALPNCQIQR